VYCNREWERSKEVIVTVRESERERKKWRERERECECESQSARKSARECAPVNKLKETDGVLYIYIHVEQQMKETEGYIYVYMWLYTYIYMYTYVHICILLFSSFFVSRERCGCVHVYMYTCIHKYTHMYPSFPLSSDFERELCLFTLCLYAREQTQLSNKTLGIRREKKRTNSTTGWRRPIGCLIFISHFPHYYRSFFAKEPYN